LKRTDLVFDVLDFLLGSPPNMLASRASVEPQSQKLLDLSERKTKLLGAPIGERLALNYGR
jgi:hypothetical protein